MLILAKAGGGGGSEPTMDTRANILATTPVDGDWACATDTQMLYFGYASAWHETPIPWLARSANPDMGIEPWSPLSGYGADFITDKNITHCLLKSSSRSEEGSIRTSGGYFQIYLNGVWNDIVVNFRLREESGTYEFEHNPVGLSWWYEISSGNSNYLGLNGLPFVQQYAASMGVFPAKLQIDGGDFTS
jgi:hypothetical protein